MNDLSLNIAQTDGGRGGRRSRNENGGKTEDVPFVVYYLRILKRRKWLMLGALTLAPIFGLVITLLMTPQYTAKSTLEISRENDRIVNVQGVDPDSNNSFDLEFYQTQYGLLASRSLAERVATNLRLYDDVEFFEMFGADDAVETLRNNQGVANPSLRQQRIRWAGEILLKNLEVVPARMSRLVEIQFTSPSPELSARVVNAWATHFIETTLARRFEATSYARRFLEQRLEQLRGRLEESERSLVGYAARQRIINLPTASPNGSTSTAVERPIVAEDLSALNQELNEAIANRMAAQSRLRGGGGTTAEALQNQAISTLRARRAELASDYARLLTQFEPQYPPAQALANQISDIDRSIAREEGRVRTTLQDGYRAALSREQMLRERVEGLQGDLLNLRGRSIQYNIYQREVDTNRQLYDALLQRYKEVGVAGGVGVNNIAVVDQAQVPEAPSSPRVVLNLLFALFLGGAIGAGLALALEQLDEAISDPTDVERTLGLPLLGTIPKATSPDPNAELQDPKSPLVEAYLSSQTSLAFTTDHGVPRTLMVTSTRPGEGKSTTSYALARSLARTNRRVLLIDGDMRSPSLHHFFNLGNASGLSNFLSGDEDLEPLIHRNLDGGLAVMTAGHTPPNAAELLTSDRLKKLLKTLSGSFDHIVIDVPPVMGLADAPLISSQVEGVVFVAESHATRVSVARVALDRLEDAHAHVLGVLLTKFQARRAHFGYGYDYGYGYGEGTSSKSAA